MRRSKKPLTAAFVAAVRKPGKYYDGQGLYLRVYSGGARCWEQRVTILGRRRTLGLGGYPTVTLLAARERALENRRLVASGLRERRRPVMEAWAQYLGGSGAPSDPGAA